MAAHDHMLEERIKDYEKIVEEQKFHVKPTKDIFGHEYVVYDIKQCIHVMYINGFCILVMYFGLVI